MKRANLNRSDQPQWPSAMICSGTPPVAIEDVVVRRIHQIGISRAPYECAGRRAANPASLVRRDNHIPSCRGARPELCR